MRRYRNMDAGGRGVGVGPPQTLAALELEGCDEVLPARAASARFTHDALHQ